MSDGFDYTFCILRVIRCLRQYVSIFILDFVLASTILVYILCVLYWWDLVIRANKGNEFKKVNSLMRLVHILFVYFAYTLNHLFFSDKENKLAIN